MIRNDRWKMIYFCLFWIFSVNKLWARLLIMVFFRITLSSKSLNISDVVNRVRAVVSFGSTFHRRWVWCVWLVRRRWSMTEIMKIKYEISDLRLMDKADYVIDAVAHLYRWPIVRNGKQISVAHDTRKA